MDSLQPGNIRKRNHSTPQFSVSIQQTELHSSQRLGVVGEGRSEISSGVKDCLGITAVCACLFGFASHASAQTADLVVTKSGPANAAAGTNVNFTINVLNTGPDDAASATLDDSIPPGMTFVSLTSPAGWTCTTPAVGSGGTVNCVNPLFAGGGSANFSLTVAIPGGTPPGTVFTNVATVSTASFDPTDENNASTAVTIVSGGASADVGITKTAPATVQACQNLVYAIQMFNAGPDPALNTQFTDTLDGNLTFVSPPRPADGYVRPQPSDRVARSPARTPIWRREPAEHSR